VGRGIKIPNSFFTGVDPADAVRASEAPVAAARVMRQNMMMAADSREASRSRYTTTMDTSHPAIRVRRLG